MGKGELAAIFEALARDVAQAGERIAASVSSLAERTADIEEANLARLVELDANAADDITAVGKKATQSRALGGDLLSRSGVLSNREVIEQGVGLPRTQETISYYANRAGVDFRGARVEIVEGADDIAYLDFQGAVARTDDIGVQLGPAAFQDEETLVRTLGHESIHVRQYQDGRVSSLTGPLEDEAYAAEDVFVETWRRSGR
jgi:hypothetical protein